VYKRQIIDISDPLNPGIAGSFSSDGYTHDAQVVNYIGPDTDYAGAEIAFAANENNIAIVNVSDKTDIQFIEHASYPSAFYTHQCWLTEDHRFLLANDELDEVNGSGNTRTFIFNVEDLDAPVYLGAYVHSTAAIDHNLYTHEGYVYESNYRAGLRILDTEQVASGILNQVAYFDIYPANDNPQFNGTWSNYPYFESGVVAVSHIEDGLFLLQPNVRLFYADTDEDGFGDPLNSVEGFMAPEGYVDNALDCDDSNDFIYKGAIGTGEGIDNDCNGTVEDDEVLTSCFGDFNFDGFINSADLSIFLGDFGCPSNCLADANGDGVTSINDLSFLLSVFGTSCNE